MAQTVLIPLLDSSGNQVRDSSGKPIAAKILWQTVAEAALSAVNAEQFPWVEWEPWQTVVQDSNGNPVINSSNNFVTSPAPYGYVGNVEPGDYWNGSYTSGVRLLTSSGPPNPAPGFVDVPDVVGLTVAQARGLIAGANLSVSGFTWAASDEAGGVVTAQNPSSETAVLPGTPVYLTLSLGASP